jgi:hypothetical protein
MHKCRSCYIQTYKAYIHTYVHTYMQTYVHTYMHTYIYADIRTYMQVLNTTYENTYRSYIYTVDIYSSCICFTYTFSPNIPFIHTS